MNCDISLKTMGRVVNLVYFLNQKDMYLSARKPYNLFNP